MKMLTAVPLESERLTYEPLRPEHADELMAVLNDSLLHKFTGGEPPSRDELRARVERQCLGESPDGRDGWLNWVVRERASERVVGTVQATLPGRAEGQIAELAWVIGTAFQGIGFGKEAATTVAVWLRSQGVLRLRAHIHRDHRASMEVAKAAGLQETPVLVDGEVRWESKG